MNLKLHHLTLALLLAGLPLAATAQPAEAAATAVANVTVLASLPVTHALAAVLLKDTHVHLERAAPANIPASRQSSYFSGRGGASLQKAASKADAVIALRSIWPHDPLYPVARRSNIRIVEIDAARPVDGALPGIAVQGTDAFATYPWLNPTNMGRMADVLAGDLGRLAPADQPRIQSNLAALKHSLLALMANSEARLADADNLAVINLSDRLGYLVSGLNLDLIDHPVVADDQWDEEALKRLAAQLKAQDVAAVLHHKQPGKAVADVIAAAGVKVIVVESDSEDALAGLRGGMEVVVEGLLQR